MEAIEKLLGELEIWEGSFYFLEGLMKLKEVD